MLLLLFPFDGIFNLLLLLLKSLIDFDKLFILEFLKGDLEDDFPGEIIVLKLEYNDCEIDLFPEFTFFMLFNGFELSVQ